MKGQQMLPNLRRLRRRGERGFTLIELLVVIVILGILAAVVVFSVRGAKDKGLGSAVAIDERTIRTAEEAYCAQKGEYASGDELAARGFLSETPKYHNVTATPPPGGPCNGWRYTIDTTPLAAGAGGSGTSQQPPPDPTTQGRWAYTKTQPDHFTAYLVRLADGKVLAGGANTIPFTAEAARVWDPVTDTWTPTDTPPTNFRLGGIGNTAFLLTDDPKTPESECNGVGVIAGGVDNCGKVFVHGRHLFDPKIAPGTPGKSQWSTVPNPGLACNICNDGAAQHTYVQMMPSVGRCGTETCGKIYIFAAKGGAMTQENYDVFDPRDNSYKPIPLLTPTNPNDGPVGGPLQLVDGRVFFCCNSNKPPLLFDPVSFRYTPYAEASPPQPAGSYIRAPDGPVLPNGGIFYIVGETPQASGIYTPVPDGPGTWKKVASCIPGGVAAPLSYDFCSVLGSLSDGRVMAMETNSNTNFDQGYKMWVYNPATEAWSQTAPLNNRQSFSTSYPNGVSLDPAGGPCGAYCNKLLVVALKSAEVYTPCPGDPAFVAVPAAGVPLQYCK